MEKNKYNDLWEIIQYLPEKDRKRLPEKFLNHVKESMDPDTVSDIRNDIPLDEQELSKDTKALLATIFLTYWAKDTEDRYEYVNRLYQNETGKDEDMPGEEYQNYLKRFDDWNELFGPIPFWAESRNFYPKKCYEIIADESEGDLQAGNTRLKEVYVSIEQRKKILEEAKQWVLTAVSENKEVLYWHDDDTDRWTSTEYIEDFYKRNAVIKDGHFHGVLLEIENTSSMGMSVYKNTEYGVLLIDGYRDGRTEEHYSHSSSEVSSSEDTIYSLQRKDEM
ncbi:MAG: hypothetical protein IKS54_02705 [Erysipelotrichaceae bacterium]|nr:hypothetical protein [Erysipelotrichaceae bacterium]